MITKLCLSYAMLWSEYKFPAPFVYPTLEFSDFNSLPQCLVIPEEPVLARWDHELSQWRTSGITLEKFKEDENLIVFRTTVFGTMAIFQDSHINMPFQVSQHSYIIEYSKILLNQNKRLPVCCQN